MHRRLEAEGGGVGRNVVHAAVGDQERAGDAIDRDVRQRRGQRAEQLGAVGFAVGLSGLDDADFQPLIFFSVSTRASCAFAVSWLRVPKFWLGLLSITTAATEDNGSRSSRVKEVGERQQDQRQRRDAHRSTARAAERSAAISQRSRRARSTARWSEQGANAMPYCMLYCPSRSRGPGVDLIGLVVAGQRVHHDVDAGAEGEFALARLARVSGSIGWPSGRIAQAPARSFEVMMIGDAVAAARRPRGCIVVLLARQVSTQVWPELKRPGKSRSR